MNSTVDAEASYNCRAFLNENGMPHHPTPSLALALHDLDIGYAPTQVMNHCHVAIVSHGAPNPADINAFKKNLSLDWDIARKRLFDIDRYSGSANYEQGQRLKPLTLSPITVTAWYA